MRTVPSTTQIPYRYLYGSLAQVDEFRMPEGEGAQAEEAGGGHEGLVNDESAPWECEQPAAIHLPSLLAGALVPAVQ